jgi:protein arginine kinase activator
MIERKMCDICKKRPAKISVTRIVGDERTDIQVCEQCAMEQGFSQPSAGSGESLASVLARGALSRHNDLRSEIPDITCSTCGTTYSAFAERELLGCADCYAAFAEPLDKFLERVHGEVEHKGKRPDGETSLDDLDREQRLRDELARAVAEEDFERAAKLRDELAGMGGGDV